MLLIEALQTHPDLLVGAVLLFGLIIGSFLNVVIYRLPIMMNREWRKQCAEIAAEDAQEAGEIPAEPMRADAETAHQAPASPAAESAELSAEPGLSASPARDLSVSPAPDLSAAPARDLSVSTAPDLSASPAPELSAPPSPAAAESPASPARETAEPRFDLLVPGSSCPACKTPIRAWQNIPLVGYAILRGRCAACGVRISLRYPIVELVTGVLSAAVAWRYGFSWEMVAALLFTWCLIALSGIDLDHKYLPDSITLPLVWLGLLSSVALTPEPHLAFPVDMRSSILGAAVGYLSLWSVYHLFKLLTGKEGMGYGDFKLFAAFGALFGPAMLLPIIVMAAGTGAIIGIALIALRRHGRDAQIPFGPYLAMAGWIALLWGPEIADLLMPGLRSV